MSVTRGTARAARAARIGRRGFLTSSAVFVSGVWTGAARADAVDDVLRDVGAARAKVRTLIAPFRQERVLSLLATSVTSKGELTLVRPDRLRWDLSPPDEATYWVGPEGIAYRTPHGSGKVPPASAGALGAILEDLLVVLGGDLTKLRERYGVTASRTKEGASLAFTPKDAKVAKVVRRIAVDLRPDLVAATRVVLEESGDDRTTITFDAARIDEPVDPARMRPP